MSKILFLVIILFQAGLCKSQVNPGEQRDPLKWPFSQTSIWNMPIGSGAVYVHARIEKALSAGMTIDEDYIVMSPDAPLMDIALNFAGWDRNKNRCVVEGKVLFSAPIPTSFIVSPQTWIGTTPNAGLAALMPDGRTIRQTQPFAHCTAGQPGTSQYLFEDQDIYGEGFFGSHGGSGLSAIGGTLRLGELTPTSDPIRHALKVNLFGRRNIYYDVETKGHRWPAKRADGYAKNTPWARDMDRIFLNLHTIDNNSDSTRGGGGTPLMPMAPPFKRK